MRIKPDTEKAKLARRSMETILDKAVWGATASKVGGFKGLIHNDNSTSYTSDATYGSNGAWSAAVVATPEKIVHDIRGMADAAFLETKGAFNQFDLFLPPELGVKLGQPMSLLISSVRTNLNMSIGEYVLANVPRVRSISVDNFRLTDAVSSGTHRALLYPRDPEVLDAFVPLDFEQFAPQLSGMAFVTHCHGKYGGLRVKHPKAIRRLDLTV